MLSRRNDIFDLMERMFFEDFNNVYKTSCKYNLDCEFREDDDKYIIQIPAVGFDKEDVIVEVEDDMLIVKAEVKEEKEKSKFVKSFEKKFVLENIDVEKIKCSLDKGLLEIIIPKKIEKKKTFRIPIV